MELSLARIEVLRKARGRVKEQLSDGKSRGELSLPSTFFCDPDVFTPY
jgi:hypothetical protein